MEVDKMRLCNAMVISSFEARISCLYSMCDRWFSENPDAKRQVELEIDGLHHAIKVVKDSEHYVGLKSDVEAKEDG